MADSGVIFQLLYFPLSAHSSPLQVNFCKSRVNYSLEHHYKLCNGKLFSHLHIMNFTKNLQRGEGGITHVQKRKAGGGYRHFFSCLNQIIPVIIGSESH